MSATEEVSVDATNEFQFRPEVVKLDDIYVDRFQRPLDERWLRKRDGKFKPALVGSLVLSERTDEKGVHSAVDGQHRLALLRRESKRRVDEGREPITEWLALVYFDLTIEQEAELFADLQRERRAITPAQRHAAEVVAGNERALAIDQIVHEEEFVLGEQEGAGSIRAVVALEKIYDDSPERVRLVLRLLRKTWGDLPGAVSERMIRALWYFVQETGEDLDEARFIERLGAVTPSNLVMRAYNLREFKQLSGTLPRYLAEAIQDAYRTKKRPTRS